jgi:hypothetical protein
MLDRPRMVVVVARIGGGLEARVEACAQCGERVEVALANDRDAGVEK